ncbi:hypothetical protein, partial [Streptomyces sp. NPDC059994]|uniref:hypothetical protein n=1 Tax=Streptomyces sp. NPDC059994 TaxID=3347029 RepID=UPI00368D4167
DRPYARTRAAARTPASPAVRPRALAKVTETHRSGSGPRPAVRPHPRRSPHARVTGRAARALAKVTETH